MAKYNGMRKVDRNKALFEYWQAHPEASLSQIGKIFGGLSKRGLSKQRVSQLIRASLNKDRRG